MNPKTKRIVEELNELGWIIAQACNNACIIDKAVSGKYIYVCDGKIYNNKKMYLKALEESDYESDYEDEREIFHGDYRDHDFLDPRIAKYVCKRIFRIIKDNYHVYTNDEFTILVGAIVNQYYFSGLHTWLGDFDVSKLDEYVVEERLRRYIHALCECIRARVWLFSKDITELTAKKLNINMENHIKVSDNVDEINEAYLYDILYYEDNIDKKPDDLDVLHNKLIKIEPQYRWGYLYPCIREARESCTNNSMKYNYVKYVGKLGIDLYSHAIGTPKLIEVSFIVKNGQIEVDYGGVEGFDLGIPYIYLKDGIMCSTESGEYVMLTNRMFDEVKDRLDDYMISDSFFDNMYEKIDSDPCTYMDVRKHMAKYLELGDVVFKPVLTEYVHGNESSFVGQYDNMSFKEYFRTLVYESGRSEREIAKTVGFNSTYTNSIINGKVKDPSTNTLLTFAISLKLSYDKMQILLKKAGHCISDRDDINGKKERILVDHIINGMYNVTDINIQLDAAGLPILGAKDK